MLYVQSLRRVDPPGTPMPCKINPSTPGRDSWCIHTGTRRTIGKAGWLQINPWYYLTGGFPDFLPRIPPASRSSLLLPTTSMARRGAVGAAPIIEPIHSSAFWRTLKSGSATPSGWSLLSRVSLIAWRLPRAHVISSSTGIEHRPWISSSARLLTSSGVMV